MCNVIKGVIYIFIIKNIISIFMCKMFKIYHDRGLYACLKVKSNSICKRTATFIMYSVTTIKNVYIFYTGNG